MLFTSYEFLGFTAALLLLYYLLPKRCQWPLLLGGSILFYLAAGPKYILYILVTGFTSWFVGVRMGRNTQKAAAFLREHKEELSKEERKEYKEGQRRIRRRWLIGCLVLNLGILAVVKYLNFFLANLNGLLGAMGQAGRLSFFALALPLGISFYTFQAVGYLVDVYRGTVKAEENPFRFLLFVSFFPLLIQGPISRFGELGETLYGPHAFDGKQVRFGLERMLWGYFKKLVVADRILAAVMTIVGDVDTYQGAYAAVGMLFYTIQLYADFTGGIDVTIGLAQTLGITVRENFNRPYFSKSLKEYWRRWHISMCSWFRDYLFYPLSTSKGMQRFTRFARKRFGDKVGKRLPVYVSSFVVWFSTGLWHGASWNFIVWGLLNYVVLMASEELEPLYAGFHRRFAVDGKGWYKLFQVGRTFALVCVLNIFDCYASLGETVKAIGSVFTVPNWAILWNGGLLELGLSALDYGILALGCLLMLGVSLAQRSGSVREKIHERPYWVRFAVWYGLFLVVLLMGAYGVGYDQSQFIYNRF